MTLKKSEIEIKNFNDIVNCFSIPFEDQKLLQNPAGFNDFCQIFKLNINTQVGEIIISILELLETNLGKGFFLDDTFSFWKNNVKYRMSLSSLAIPADWKPFLQRLEGSENEKKLKFMFCLESTLILISKLILVKVCDDYQIPNISLKKELISNLPYFREKVPLYAFPIFIINIFNIINEKLISSIFEEDIYLWWQELFERLNQIYLLNKKEFVSQLVNNTLEHFGKSIEKILISLYSFNFEKIEDLLGNLYQSYFNVETRKALGEFYTPKEVVNRILDEIGYVHNLENKRLLDPACGSGTFLIGALRRYFTDVSRCVREPRWDIILNNLCNKSKIVGFDINPFACLISQVRFLIEVIPKYKLALDYDPQFIIQNIPIFMTDSLEIERLSLESQILSKQFEDKMKLGITLPILNKIKIIDEEKKAKRKEGKEFESQFIKIELFIPLWDKGNFKNLINNIDEYFIIIFIMFNQIKKAIKNKSFKINLNEFTQKLNARGLPNADLIVEELEQYFNSIISIIMGFSDAYKREFLIKLIENLYLAGILKNFIQYDFIVGNPPYVDIKKIPKDKRDYYLGNSRSKIYESGTGRLNLYILFIERSISNKIGFLKNSGNFGFILPTAFMVYSGYGLKIRDIILKNTRIKKIINLNLCSRSIFLQDVSTQIIILNKVNEPVEDYKFCSTIIKKDEISLLNNLKNEVSNRKDIQTDYIYIKSYLNTKDKIMSPFLFNKNQSILEKMNIKAKKLHEITVISQGIRIGSRKTRNLVIRDELSYQTLPDEKKLAWRRHIDAEDTDQFIIKWNKTYLKFFPDTSEEILYLPRSREARLEKQKLFERSKLLFKNTAQKLSVSFDSGSDKVPIHEKFYFPLNTLYCIVSKDYKNFKEIMSEVEHEEKNEEMLDDQELDNEEVRKREKYYNENTRNLQDNEKVKRIDDCKDSDNLLKYLLGYLNSPLAEFWYRVMYWGLAIPGGGMKYREVIKNIPVKIPKNEQEVIIFNRIISQVDKIRNQMNIKLNVENAKKLKDIDSYQEQLNDLLFKFYSLEDEKEYILDFLKVFCPKINW